MLAALMGIRVVKRLSRLSTRPRKIAGASTALSGHQEGLFGSIAMTYKGLTTIIGCASSNSASASTITKRNRGLR